MIKPTVIQPTLSIVYVIQGRDWLKELHNLYPDQQHSFYNSIPEGIKSLSEHHANLLIINSELLTQEGIEQLQQLSEDSNVTVIFPGNRDDLSVFSNKKNFFILENGDLKSLQCVIDMTLEINRVKREKEAIESELGLTREMLSNVFESIIDVFISVDMDGIIRAISPSIKDLMDYTPEEVIGTSVTSYYAHPEDREHFLEHISKYGKIENYETRIRCKDGGIKTIVANSRVRKNIDGMSIDSTFTDITQQKKIKDKCDESQELIAKVQNLAHLGTWTWDTKKNKVEWSEELYRIYGLDHNSFGASFEAYLERVHPSDRERVMQLIQNALQTKSEFKFEEIIVRPDGEERHLKSWGAVKTDENGDPLKMYGICLDVTDSKLQEHEILKQKEKLKVLNLELETIVKHRTSELEKAKSELEIAIEKEKDLNELKSRFVSDASHQFRTPLTVIKSNVSLIDILLDRNIIDDPRRIEQYAKRIGNEVNRMTSLMDDMLILGKIESGVIQVKESLSDLLQVCIKVASEYSEIQDDGRAISVHYEGTPYDIMLDAKLFEEALSNIISNAFKYSKGRPDPVISIVYEEDSVVVSVEDFGIGIPKGEMEKMFTPFYRASNVDGIQGTGLGTTIIKEYTELIGGKLLVESTVNKGTCFKLIFKSRQ